MVKRNVSQNLTLFFFLSFLCSQYIKMAIFYRILSTKDFFFLTSHFLYITKNSFQNFHIFIWMKEMPLQGLIRQSRALSNLYHTPCWFISNSLSRRIRFWQSIWTAVQSAKLQTWPRTTQLRALLQVCELRTLRWSFQMFINRDGSAVLMYQKRHSFRNIF